VAKFIAGKLGDGAASGTTRVDGKAATLPI
jgi:hypothetical protein